ncbi:IgGFc-binding protein [Mizuhopecten yessoensis]|uniref:IgGFc-binding protein n=1 Tax=Mizuhopecten yessoensis TaxID=6573 RepID=A0A210PKA4_MIZYE|nr:IgGFc-binding protein [Mizuhopecten yessoensis]
MKTITLSPALAVNGSVKCEKGIRIDSDHPTFVYGNNRQQSHTSMDEFLSIPRRELGNLYYVITGKKRPQLLVVGLYANTSLNITVRATSGASYQNESYLSGQTLYETMKEYDTIQIVSEKRHNDFTGTEIKSSKPVSVFSGSQFSESSHLAEQIPTVAKWGEHHVTAPPADEFLYNTTIVAAFPNTLLNFSCLDGSEKLLTLAEAGSFLNMRPSNVTCLISSTRPVLVSIAIYSYTADTSMTIIQPMKRVLGDLMFLAPENVYCLNLVVVTYCNSSLTLDKESLGTMKIDGDSGICIGRASIGTGIHTIRSSGHAFFISGYIHGTKNINSIAFPLVPNCDEVSIFLF